MRTIMEKLKGMKTSHKYVLGIGLFVVVTLLSFLLTKPDGYIPLYKGLNEQDKQDILVEMSRMGVDYKLSESGLDISVKEENASWVRNQMTQLGLPRLQGSDYASYIEGGLGDTQGQKEFKELNFKKGQLEVELVRVHPFIETATVRLTAPPKTSIFDDSKASGSAAVTLGIKAGHKLTRNQILGIQHMVASSMQGIGADDVTIIDSKNGIISGDIEDDVYGSTAYEKQMGIKDKTEARIKGEINDTLASIFGFSNVKINVMVDINFDKVERQIETFADEGVLRSLNSQAEDTRKTEGDNLQEAGVDANGDVVGYEVDENGNIINYEQSIENVTENYEIDRTIESIIKNPEMTNTNISIWLDKAELEKRENFDMDAFRQSIAIAAGMKPDAEGNYINGFVSIFSENFYEEEIEVVEEDVTGIEKMINDNFWAVVISAAALLLLVTVLIIVLAKKKKKTSKGKSMQGVTEGQASYPQNNQALEGVATGYQDEDRVYINKELTDEDLGIESQEEKNRRLIREERQKRLDEQIQSLSSEHPKETADYVKKLLSKRG